MSERSQMIFGFALINMKKSIPPYANKTNPLITSGAVGSTAGNGLGSGGYPHALVGSRADLIRQFDAFCETINKSGSAKDLGPAFGSASEIGKRNVMFTNLEKSFEGYTTQLITHATHSWNPPSSLAYSTGVDKDTDALMASCMPMDEDPTTARNVGEKAKAASTGVRNDPASPTNRCAFYYYWTNCLGETRTGGPGGGQNLAVADWRYEIASMHFNMAVIYLNAAAYLAFLVGAVSYPNYYGPDASAATRYANTSQASAMEKECYAYCCSSAYHFEQALVRMREVLGEPAGPIPAPGTRPAGTPSSASGASGSTSYKEALDNLHLNAGGTDKPGQGGKEGSVPDPADAPITVTGVQSSQLPIDMTMTFLSLMREVMVAQGQEICVAKALRAGREDSSVGKMSFTSIAGRLMLGAKLLFANAEAISQKDLVVMKQSFASFISSIQTKAALYEAIAYSVQGAYMAVPITASQRMEVTLRDRERVANGGAPSSAAAAIGEDAGANPEDGLWCLERGAQLAAPLPDRAVKTSCAPSVRIWMSFMIQRYISDIQTNIAELQRMGLPKKGSAGPVTLKSAMIVARVKKPQPVPEK